MNKIASFSIDHDKLKKGVYVSRVDRNVITYDIRMKCPNKGDYLSNGELHTFEHLFATYARNSKFKDSVVYIGPMGCRTGFYMLLFDDMSKSEVLELLREAFDFIKDFEGEVPGAQRAECGNFKDHDLAAAKIAADDMLLVLSDWDENKFDYNYSL